MGRASSSKKVARAAGTGGGRTHRGRTPWTYYSVIAVVVVLGILGTWASRDRRVGQINNQGGDRRRRLARSGTRDTPSTSAASFSPAITHAKNPEGITTGNGDGIIHIHPTVKAAAGKNATLGKFADAAGMKLNAATLQLPGGKLYQDGDTCKGKASHVYVKEFAFAGDTTGTLQNVDPRKILLQDQSLLTIAFVPASDKDKIPPPPTYVINNLNKLAATSPSPHHDRPRLDRDDRASYDTDDEGADLDHGEEVVQAVVLVGGEGTRLRPLTLTTPKQMLPVGRRPMIERVLSHLARHRIEGVVLSLGYRPDAFTDAYPDGAVRGRRPLLRRRGRPARHRRGDRFRGPRRRASTRRSWW